MFLMVGSSAHDVSIPYLSCDDRSVWAVNRKHLQDLSLKNRESLELIEQSIMIVSFDENSPRSWEETALHTITGDIGSKWGDKSLTLVSFKNGSFGYIGSTHVQCCRMLALRFNKNNSQDFTSEAEKLAESFQRALISEGVSKEKSKELTIDKTVDVCRANAKSDLAKAVLAATTYNDPKDVIAKLVLESSTEIQERQVLSFRGRYRGNRRDCTV